MVDLRSTCYLKKTVGVGMQTVSLVIGLFQDMQVDVHEELVNEGGKGADDVQSRELLRNFENKIL